MSKTAVSIQAAAAAAREKKASKPQWSTSISDAVLALFTLYACSQLRDVAVYSSQHGRAGAAVGQWQLVAVGALSLAGLAASAGVFRFAGVVSMQPLHDGLTKLSMFFTMPVLGIVGVVAYAGYVSGTHTLMQMQRGEARQ